MGTKSEKRQQNENEYELWIEKEDGGRIYFEVQGKSGWKARYVKEVDGNEVTLKFYQEIYDESDVLREIHEKYPIDMGTKNYNNGYKKNYRRYIAGLFTTPIDIRGTDELG
jgi:hypothetical protein